jgi:hypothetical protein
VCIDLDPACSLLACKFLVSLAANVTPNHKVNYFLSNVVTHLGGVLLRLSAADRKTADAASQEGKDDAAVPDGVMRENATTLASIHEPSADRHQDTPNNTTVTETTPATEENGPLAVADSSDERRELETFIYVLLTYLVPLHPTHAQIIMRHPLHLPRHTVARLRHARLSESGECAALLFLDSLCTDTHAKAELKVLISVDLMRLKMSICCPTVTEKATKLFLSLFAEDIECNYRPRSSVNPRESSHTSYRSHSHTPRSHSGADGDADGANVVRSDRSWSISGVTCLRDLLNIVLTITEAGLKGQPQSEGLQPDQERLNSARASSVGIAAIDTALDAMRPASSSAAFHYLNSIVYHVGLCVEIHRICSLHDVVARIVALILEQFQDMSAFDLANAKIIDTLFLLIGVRERCWQPRRADLIDEDYLSLNPALVEHFMSIADPVLTDGSDDRTLPASPGFASDTNSTGNMLNAKVVSYAREHFLRDASFLENFLEDWEVESIETICQKLLLVYCRLQLGGIEAIIDILELEPFEEMLWDVLSDDRHGIDAYPEMRRKCIQLFTSIGIHLQSTVGTGVTTAGSPSPVSPPPTPTASSTSPVGMTGPPPPVAATVGIAVPSANANDPTAEILPPKELAHAAPLAELALKILTTQEHMGSSDEDDEIDLPAVCAGLSANKITAGTAVPAGTQSNKARAAVRTEGGKCVSRIFRTRKHILQLRYSALSCVMHVCETTRTVRRKVIANYAEIVRNFSHLDPVKSMAPLLQLVALASEYLTKVESAGEEAIVTLLVRCLRYPDADVRTLACEIIAVIGAASPGLLHRGVCRPEIEDLLIDILRTACDEEELQQHSGPLVRAVLKACNALTHDINIKPGWIPTPYTYHWSRYTSDISQRPLFVPSFLDTLQLVVRRASRTYVIQYCALVLSIVTCLMYACNDGVFSAKSGDAYIIELKAALLQRFLPWMPIALDYLTSHRKIIRSLMAAAAASASVNTPATTPSAQHMHVMPTILEGSSSGTTPSIPTPSNAVTSHAVSATYIEPTSPPPTPTNAQQQSGTGNREPTSFKDPPSSKESSSKSSGKSGLSAISGGISQVGGGLMRRMKRQSSANNVPTPDSPVASERRHEVRYSPCAEHLAEKLIEAMHAFLCMDEMFPLSTYLQNATMFNGTPVIACVSYFMTECRANLKVQRRGIDFLRHFADNQIGLSSIAMHSPSAIIHASRLLSDTLEVQYSFCRIVSSVARSDEFARENFIRFNVQSWLVELIHRQHAEQSRLACIAASDLCATPADAISVCQGTGVIEAVIALLDALPNEFKVQVEGVRVLVTADQVPELLAPTRKLSAAQVLKKTKKFLNAALKQESFPEGYDRSDVENLLNSALWAKDPLLTKILGFFG